MIEYTNIYCIHWSSLAFGGKVTIEELKFINNQWNIILEQFYE